MHKFALTFTCTAAFLLFAAFTPAQQDDAKKRADEIKAGLDQIQKLQAALDKLKAQDAPKKDGDPPTFKRGAKRTPIPKIIEALRTGRASVHRNAGNTPASVAMVPKRLSYWGNNQFGDCVTAEECAAFAEYSTFLNVPEVFITEATCIAWATSHGVRDGADLLQVMQMMETDGIKDENGKLWKIGTPSTVDYSNESLLQNAISLGPVNVAIDANALPSGAGNANGWFSFGGKPGEFGNTDHCVNICGFGPAKDMCAALGVPVPAGAPTTLYLVFTWNTIGLTDHKWVMSTVVEAWLRTPTVVGLTPPTPPPPVTVAIADATGVVGQAVTFLPMPSGGTGPYKFGYDYGDGAKDGTGIHTYTSAGTYTVNVTAADSGGLFGDGSCKAVVSSTPIPIPPIPTPGAPQITLRGVGADADGDYFLLKQALGNTRLIDILTQQQPARPTLTPAQRQALQEILNALGKDKK